MLDPLSVNIATTTVKPSRPVHPRRYLLQPSPTHPDDYILEFDYSAISKFMECPRMGENYLIHGREADKDHSATDFGRLFHTLEEQRRRASFTPEVRKKQIETITEHFVLHPVPVGDHRTAPRMEDVTKLYYEKFANDGIEKKIYRDAEGLFVERPFKVELCTVEVNAFVPYNPHQLVNLTTEDPTNQYPYKELMVRHLHIFATGRIDLVLEEAGGLWVLDDKTTSRGGNQFANWFRLSNQTRGYCWAVREITKKKVMGCIVNAIIVRPYTKTGKHTEFNRLTYFYNEDSITEWFDNIRATAQDFVACLVRGYFPQYARSFISPCDNCDYFDNCSLPKAQRAADLASNLYRDVTWSPMNE